jgi:hypothetical protein
MTLALMGAGPSSPVTAPVVPIGIPIPQGVGGNGSSATTQSAATLSDVLAGEHLVAVLSSSNANIATAISDSVNGSAGWTLGPVVTPAPGSATFRLAYRLQASTLPPTTLVTATHPLTSGNKTLALFSVSGLDPANPIDLVLAGVTATSDAPSYTSAAFNSAKVLAIGAVWRSGATGDSYDDQAPFTNLNVASAGAGSADLHVDYSIRSTAAAVTVAPLIGASRLWAALIVGLKGQ